MKEIKFRYRFKNRKTEQIIMAVLTIQQVENRGFTPNVFQEWLTWEVLSRDLWTGLHDKNGKEIWEGDICRNTLNPTTKYPIIFKNGSFCFHHKPLMYFEVEVIGNIYENSELLENIGKNKSIKSKSK